LSLVSLLLRSEGLRKGRHVVASLGVGQIVLMHCTQQKVTC